MLLLCVRLGSAAEEAAPALELRLAPETPFPALREAARANQIPLDQIDSGVQTNLVRQGDSFTAVVALHSRRPQMQWLLFLQAVEPTPKEQKENQPHTFVTYNTLGHKIEFRSAPTPINLRTIGPFAEAATKKWRDTTAHFVLDQDFLGLGLDQAAAAILRMYRSSTNGPFMSGTEAFGEDVLTRCRKANETWRITAAEERALAASYPALLSYFSTVQQTPELAEIVLKALDRPSLWSMLWHAGISSTEFSWDAKHLAPADSSGWQVPGRPAAYYCPMTLLLNHHPALDMTLVVTAPQPPLLTCGGVLGLLAEKPGDKQTYLTLRIVSARHEAKG